MACLTKKAINDPEKKVSCTDNGCCDVIICIEELARLIFKALSGVVDNGLHNGILKSRA